MKLRSVLLGAAASEVAVAHVGFKPAPILLDLNSPDLSEASLMKMEHLLEDSMALGAKGAAMGRSTGLFDDLSKMINGTMGPAILQAHDSAQEQLEAIKSAFSLCLAPKEQVTGADGIAMYPDVKAKLDEHRQCRATQAAAKKAQDECDGALARQRTVAKASCDAVPGSDGSPPPLDKDGHVGCEVTPGDYKGWLRSFRHQIDQLRQQYDDAKAGCGNATKIVEDSEPKCIAAKSLNDGNKSACDAVQLAADMMGCSGESAAGHACTAYDGCYEAAKSNYLDQNESIAASQLNRTVQWRTLKRMQCLLKEESAGASHAGIDKCKEAIVDTSHLDLMYPEIPEKSDCAEIKVTKHGPEPCSSEWVEQYGQLASPAAACTPCSTTTTTTWVLLLRQTFPYKWPKNELAVNSADNTKENFAILDKMESFRFYGEFTFKLVWPNLQPQIWKQTTDPTKKKVKGYKEVTCPYKKNRWGGLEKSGNAGRNLMDGSVNHGWWWYSVGSTALHQGGYPGPNGIVVKHVELYAWVGSYPTSYLPNDDSWPLVFRQTYPFKFTDGQWSLNPAQPASANFAVLDQLEHYRSSSDGKLEFKMVWPDSGQGEQWWRQSSNPVTRNKRGVEGYEQKSLFTTKNHWGGLENNLGKSTLLDGSVGHGNWWYAVGSKKFHQGAYPGPAVVVNTVELYVHYTAPPTPPPSSLPSVPCRCAHPGLGTSGIAEDNSYSCEDGTQGACPHNEECIAEGPFVPSNPQPNTDGCAVVCWCNSPGGYGAGQNGYSCSDDTSSFCASDEMCGTPYKWKKLGPDWKHNWHPGCGKP